MTEGKEYLFMHTYFQIEVLANHDEPNPSLRQAENQAHCKCAPFTECCTKGHGWAMDGPWMVERAPRILSKPAPA